MRLVIETDDTRVVAVDALEKYLEPATGGVQGENIGAVLRAIRETASALMPPSLDPERLERVSAVLFQNAEHLRALAEAAPPGDPDAAATLKMLEQLGLYDPPVLAPKNTKAPLVTGLSVVGQTLTCDPGEWTGNPALAFQWQRSNPDGTNPGNVANGTASTLVIPPQAQGLVARCRVTATNATGSAQAVSNTVGPIVP